MIEWEGFWLEGFGVIGRCLRVSALLFWCRSERAFIQTRSRGRWVVLVRTVQRVWVESRVKSRRIGQSALRLSFAEREQISRGLAAGESVRAIARTLGRFCLDGQP